MGFPWGTPWGVALGDPVVFPLEGPPGRSLSVRSLLGFISPACFTSKRSLDPQETPGDLQEIAGANRNGIKMGRLPLGGLGGVV